MPLFDNSSIAAVFLATFKGGADYWILRSIELVDLHLLVVVGVLLPDFQNFLRRS